MKEAPLLRREMQIDQRHQVVGLARPVPGEDVGLHRVELDRARRGEPPRLGDAAGGEIERVDQ